MVAGTTLNGVHGSSATDVWAVGQGGAIRHFDGLAWSTVASPTTQRLNRVVALSPSDAWAVGAAVTAHWNGTAWAAVSQPIASATFTDLWAASASDLWAAGPSGSIIRWNGSTWGQVTPPVSNTAGVVWGSNSTDVWFPTLSGTILKWNGTAIVDTGLGPIAINRLWGTGSSDVYAATSFGTGVSHFNGTAWSDESTANTQPLYAVHGAGSHVWSVGAGAAIVMKSP